MQTNGGQMIDKNQVLQAMRADNIPAGWAGLWYVQKAKITEATDVKRHGKPTIIEPGLYTFLYRVTDSTINYNPPGECVMEDSLYELQTHLGFIMQARGRVLITGLGLGCVIRGLLQNPDVESVTCIENSKDVLRLVEPHMPKDRLTIIEAEALEWTAKNTQSFDCGWHDLWTNRDEGEPHLDMWHAQLFRNCHKTVLNQGAWAFDRQMKNRLLRKGFPWMG